MVHGRELKLLIATVEFRTEHAPQGCKASALTTAPILFHSPTNLPVTARVLRPREDHLALSQITSLLRKQKRGRKLQYGHKTRRTLFILSQNLLSRHKKQTLKRSETHAPGAENMAHREHKSQRAYYLRE